MKNVILIVDSPMTLGVQVLMTHIITKPILKKHYNLNIIFAFHQDFSMIEKPFTKSEEYTLLNYLKSQKPAIIGISSIQRTRTRTMSILPKIRQHLKNTIIIAGGVDACGDPKFYLNQGVDLIVLGDGELPFEKLMKQLIAGKSRNELIINPPEGFKSEKRDNLIAQCSEKLSLPYYGEKILRLAEGKIKNIDKSFANPEHSQFLGRAKSIDMITRRGCTHHCSFCAQDLGLVYKGTSMKRAKNNLREVVNELSRLKHKYKSKEFVYFWDLDFFRRSKSELLEFAKLYKKKVNLPFFIFVTEKSVNYIGKNILSELIGAGLQKINMGIQSGSSRMLKFYNRNASPKEILNAIRIIHEATKKHKVEILYDILTYVPEEKSKDILDTIKLVIKIPTKGKQIIRLATHKLSSNTGQGMLGDNTTNTDYQDFINDMTIYKHTQSPYLSFLLGKLMRGYITQQRIGSVKRDMIQVLLKKDLNDHDKVLTLSQAFIPLDNDSFL